MILTTVCCEQLTQHSFTTLQDRDSRPGQTKEKEHGRLQQLKLNQLGAIKFSVSFVLLILWSSSKIGITTCALSQAMIRKNSEL